MKRILFNSESSGGGGAGGNLPALQDPPGSSPPTPPPAAPTPAPVPAAPAAAPAPPPAATTVLEGEKTERELKLEKELAEANEAKKKVELRNAQLEDDNRHLKQGGRAFKFK